MKPLFEKYLVVLLALITPFLFIIGNGSFAFTGASISAISIAGYIYSVSSKDNKNKIIFAITVFFSVCLIFRANPILTFFNVLAILYSLSFAIKDPDLLKGSFKILNLLVYPLSVLAHLVNVKRQGFYNNFFRFDFGSTKNLSKENVEKSRNKFKINKVLEIVIAILLLFTIVPLLASSNPIFNNLVKDFIRIFNFEFILNSLSNLISAASILRAIVFAILIIFLPRISELKKLDQSNKIEDRKESNYQLFYPKLTGFITILIFIITQVQLYLSSKEYLIELGYSYGRLANEVFFQLSLV